MPQLKLSLRGLIYSDPYHPDTDRYVAVTNGGKNMEVSGFDLDDKGVKVNWGPFIANVDGSKIVVDFSPKGGPSDWDLENP